MTGEGIGVRSARPAGLGRSEGATSAGPAPEEERPSAGAIRARAREELHQKGNP